MKTHRYYLERAMQLAEHAYKAGTYPIGAIIVDPGGTIIGQGYNHVYTGGDFTSHAEVEAIRSAGKRLMKKPNYEACTLYTTMEPCLMCCGAILLARIKRVIWVIDDDLHGALRELYKNVHSPTTTLQKKESEFSVPENCSISCENSDEATPNSASFQGNRVLNSLYTDEIASLAILPAGYTDRIASLSILTACEDDLAERMYDWMNNWNAAKDTTLNHWR